MARWKARVEYSLSMIELLFLSLTVEALQGKIVVASTAIAMRALRRVVKSKVK